ncbi:MAG: GspE/PulE family protein, partial [bacterium]|nr:GspE/PulE family protein [bacterium]
MRTDTPPASPSIFKDIDEILVENNAVSQDDMQRAREHAARTGESVIDYLLANEIMTREQLGKVIADTSEVAFADLAASPPSHNQVRSIPETLARSLRMVLFTWDEESVTIATDTPKRSMLKEAIASVYPEKIIHLAFAFPDDIDSAFTHYQDVLDHRVDKIVARGVNIAPQIVDAVMQEAVAMRASDIHFEPQENEVLIRVRIDGELRPAATIPPQLYDMVLNRLKIQANMRIDEHNASQDGAIRFHQGKETIDMRISVVPTVEGEKAELRLLAEYVKDVTFDNLGLSPRDQSRVHEASQKPFGMILATGPTGSGKTTTLYGILKRIKTPEVNVMTIEDPVEYRVRGINQIQVNSATNMTFASGLRSIVRQDPDIILVGEIRDKETAEIAVNASLTGHLVLSTFHTNDAATAIPRLLEMGVEPFLLASTLELIVAQRLVRKICQNCRVGRVVSRAFGEPDVTLYTGRGC